MNCSDNESVCSVKKENNLGYYRLHTIWRKDGFFINITSKNGAWRGEMTPRDIEKMSAQLEVDPQNYLTQCKNALTQHEGQPGIVYAVENGSFVWKKVEDEDSGIKVKLGSIMLQPTSFEDTIQNLVTAALNCNKSLEGKLKQMTEEYKKVLEHKNELLNKLNELTEIKVTMENDLYSRFILLINSKKRKILELENLLEEEYKKHGGPSNPYEIETDKDSEEEVTITSKNKKGRVRKNIRDSEEEVTVKSKTKKGKKGVRKNIQERNKIKSPLPAEESQMKEVENVEEETDDSMTSGSLTNLESNLCEPSTSGTQIYKENVVEKMSLTKDELYDFFYGEQ